MQAAGGEGAPSPRSAPLKDRRPELDAAELKRHAKRAKAELQRAVEVPVPPDHDEDAADGGDADEACSVIGNWKSAKGGCRVFEDHITSRLSYEEPIGDGSRLHGWLVKRDDEQIWESSLSVLEEGERPWYGPSFGEEPESVGDIRVRLTGKGVETQIRVDGEDNDWQPPVCFRRKPGIF
mmetsp:Transcript_7448/g.20111  ORF Transcript_7448/g.20111 Transcript_7448/m.20111 type:complete len:180 (-) Transcript_7448:95-634(-)